MTTYKLTVPIKCKTIHKVWKKIVEISKIVITICALSSLGFLNGLVFYILFHPEEVRNYALSNGGSWVPGGEFYMALLMGWVDIVIIMCVFEKYNINFELGCIKEGGEE